MTRKERIQEIVGNMKSFTRETYYKEDLLPELLLLQKEMSEAIFDGEQATQGDLRIWDVCDHLKSMSEASGGVASEELADLLRDCNTIINLIKAECSGKKGEDMTFSRLEALGYPGRLLRNIELSDKDFKTEIDGIVVTPKAIFVIEVKNSRRNIFIDENGDMYRCGDYTRFDSSLGEKMNGKVGLVRRTLEAAGFCNLKILSQVVFTNRNIEIQNKCRWMKHCHLARLPYIIQEFSGESLYTEANKNAMCMAIQTAEHKESYSCDIDIAKFKEDFANVLTLLEEASSSRVYESEVVNIPDEDSEPETEVERKTTRRVFSQKKQAISSERFLRYASIAAVFTITTLSAMACLKKY